MTYIEPRRRPRLVPFIIVVAGRAVGSADHAADAGQQQFDPFILGFPGHFDFLEAVVPRMLHHPSDGLRGVGQIVRHVGDEIGSLRRLHEECVRKAVHMDAVLAAHALGPMLRQFYAASPRHVEAGAPLVLGADLEPRRVDDAVELVFLAGGHDPAGRDLLDSLAVGIHQMRPRRVERLQIGIVEARPLAELAIPGLEFCRRFAILDDGVDPAPDFLHFFEVGILKRSSHVRHGALLARQ